MYNMPYLVIFNRTRKRKALSMTVSQRLALGSYGELENVASQMRGQEGVCSSPASTLLISYQVRNFFGFEHFEFLAAHVKCAKGHIFLLEQGSCPRGSGLDFGSKCQNYT